MLSLEFEIGNGKSFMWDLESGILILKTAIESLGSKLLSLKIRGHMIPFLPFHIVFPRLVMNREA